MTMELAPRNGHAETAVARRASVQDDGPLAFMMDTDRFEHMQRVASAMSASVFLPQHLRGKGSGDRFEPYPPQTVMANCFRVLNQAMRWGVDPFAVCDETFVTGGKLGYQGKLIAAIINSRAGLQGRLNYKFSGAGPARKVVVSATFKGASEPSEIELTVAQGIKASDKGKGPNQMWLSDPDQKLVYSGVVKWARRWCPEVIMGVLTEDDIDAIESRRAEAEKTPTADLNAKLAQAFTQPVAAAALTGPVDATTGEVLNEMTADDSAKADALEADSPAANPAATTESQPSQADDGAGAAPDEPALDTYPQFTLAMESHAESIDMPPADLTKLMGAIALHHKVKSAKTSEGPAARRAVYAAFVAGKLGADGKIQQ